MRPIQNLILKQSIPRSCINQVQSNSTKRLRSQNFSTSAAFRSSGLGGKSTIGSWGSNSRVSSIAIGLGSVTLLGLGSISILGLGWSEPLLAQEAKALPEKLVGEDSGKDGAVYTDPTTKAAFPSSLGGLKLVGTGVRTVSFLGIQVYTAGFYLDGRVLDSITNAQELSEDLEGIIQRAIEKGDCCVLVVPLRNTSLTHLRDAYVRTLMARVGALQGNGELGAAESESAFNSIQDLKSLFWNKTLSKQSWFGVNYSAEKKEIVFTIREAKKDGSLNNQDVMGILEEPTLAKQMILSYFSKDGAPSEKLKTSVREGLAGESR